MSIMQLTKTLIRERFSMLIRIIAGDALLFVGPGSKLCYANSKDSDQTEVSKADQSHCWRRTTVCGSRPKLLLCR